MKIERITNYQPETLERFAERYGLTLVVVHHMYPAYSEQAYEVYFKGYSERGWGRTEAEAIRAFTKAWERASIVLIGGEYVAVPHFNIANRSFW